MAPGVDEAEGLERRLAFLGGVVRPPVRARRQTTALGGDSGMCQ